MTDFQEILNIAQAAFADFAAGLANGDWQPFLDRLSNDVTFWFPAGPFKGHNQGKEKIAAFLAMVPQVFPGGLTLEVVQITSNATTVVFEVRSTGRMGSEPYENQAAIAFDLRDGQICAYREYLGVVFQLGQ
ncbi:nuclear transport factor 2 family protein [Leptolyngbya iicbica]|uniref:Nuclear transport factor 2 family protein n=2 Tax=Cyanophyceae TaxID=3028117 RepID=A0A4Q7EG12_9CYAN|nr:nuclear transport factor 2 family protein [Leptolyngbya sp. LK]RZM82245.1 nuclear transport factor 2 family protein [Leptolyngbya sp. LK]